VAQLVIFVFFYDLPAKIGRYSEVMGRMRVREDAMKKEANHLVGERLALEEERRRWEKAREDRVPLGAFWEVVQPALNCLAYGEREYWGVLRNIPDDWTDLDACMSMPIKIKGVSVRRPDRCLYTKDSPYIHAFWTVNWDQPECKPWHQDFNDRVGSVGNHSGYSPTPNMAHKNRLKGCTNKGSGVRRIEAWVMGINERGGQDWRLLCESTPMTWNHITYKTPTHCDARVSTNTMSLFSVLPPTTDWVTMFSGLGRK
jgi:hypothetical protein